MNALVPAPYDTRAACTTDRVAHVIHDAHESIVEHRERDAKNGVQCLDARPRQPLGLVGPVGFILRVGVSRGQRTVSFSAA